MEVQTLPKSLSKLISALAETITAEGRMTPLRAKEIVVAANVREEDLMHYADFEHPVEDCYGRKLVFENDKFEVMVMSWNPGDYSSIHNHGYTQWGVVQVFGNAHHCIYHVKNGMLHFSKKEILTGREAIKVNNKLIHQMGNPSTAGFLTLHVYGANEGLPKAITADAKNFDLEFDRISHTTGGAFFNLPEHEIYEFEPSPKPADGVMLHYAHLLLDYYNRQPDSEKTNQLKKNILFKIREYLC